MKSLESIKFLFLVIFIISCNNNIGQVKDTNSNLKLELVRNDLYKDEKGNLYIRTLDDKLNESYISKMTYNGIQKPIKEVIDTATYHKLGISHYAQDKKYFYYLDRDFFSTILKIPCLSDSSKYELIRNNLFTDKKGSLYIRGINSVSENCPQYVYISKIIGGNGEMSVEQVLDKDSYQELGLSGYSKDKNNVYFFRETLESGYFNIIQNVKPRNFELIKVNGIQFGKSDKDYYYLGELVNMNTNPAR